MGIGFRVGAIIQKQRDTKVEGMTMVAGYYDILEVDKKGRPTRKKWYPQLMTDKDGDLIPITVNVPVEEQFNNGLGEDFYRKKGYLPLAEADDLLRREGYINENAPAGAQLVKIKNKFKDMIQKPPEEALAAIKERAGGSPGGDAGAGNGAAAGADGDKGPGNDGGPGPKVHNPPKFGPGKRGEGKGKGKGKGKNAASGAADGNDAAPDGGSKPKQPATKPGKAKVEGK